MTHVGQEFGLGATGFLCTLSGLIQILRLRPEPGALLTQALCLIFVLAESRKDLQQEASQGECVGQPGQHSRTIEEGVHE
ncbi:MAG: hypothetical protein VCC04_10590, partial [Myxococcota bacterium]